jgi:hypothetical protein
MERNMTVVILLGLIALAASLYWWFALPRLRQFPWWDGFTAWLWALAGNSRTIGVAYAAELLAVLDEAKIIDWSQLLGVESGGRVVAVMGIVMILLRLVTRTAVSFKPEV